MWGGSKKKNSQQQETKVAKELSGKTVVASGALWGSKGDVKTDVFLVECKTTSKSSYRLTYATWNKILHEAVNDGMRFPLMCIDLNNGKERYAVFQHNLFHGICEIPKAAFTSSEVKSILVSSGLFSNKVCCDFILCSSNSKSHKICIVPWDEFIEWSDKLICQL